MPNIASSPATGLQVAAASPPTPPDSCLLQSHIGWSKASCIETPVRVEEDRGALQKGGTGWSVSAELPACGGQSRTSRM